MELEEKELEEDIRKKEHVRRQRITIEEYLELNALSTRTTLFQHYGKVPN